MAADNLLFYFFGKIFCLSKFRAKDTVDMIATKPMAVLFALLLILGWKVEAGREGKKRDIREMNEGMRGMDTEGRGAFGFSVGVAGRRVVVGADGANKAFLFDCSSPPCRQTHLLLPSAPGESFGLSVSLSETGLVAVGAPFASFSSGAVYLFDCSLRGSCAELKRVEGGKGRGLGFAVAVEGSLVAMGGWASKSSSSSIQVLLYRCREGGECLLLDSLPVSPVGQQYTLSVALRRSLLLLAAPNDDTSGRVYLFDCSSIPCIQTDILSPWDSSSSHDFFGFSVSIGEGPTMYVGAPFYSSKRGAVYVFDCSILRSCFGVDKLEPTSDLGAESRFGISLSAQGRTLAVGADYEQGDGAQERGSAYLYHCSTPSSCSWLEKYRPSLSQEYLYFGHSVSLSESGIVVGAYGFNASQGNAFFQRLSDPCPALAEGNAVWPETPSGAYALGTCASGYWGSPSRICLPVGTWSPSISGECHRIQCPADIPEGARVEDRGQYQGNAMKKDKRKR